MTDRYRDFEAQPDLGLGFPPADVTDDIVGAQKEEDPAQDSGPGEV